MRGQLGQQPGTPAPNKDKKYPPQILTTAEVGALLAQCSQKSPTGIRNRALIMLLYRSGLRVSEILSLRPSDVDMSVGSLRLPKTKSGKAQVRGYHPSAGDSLGRWVDRRAVIRAAAMAARQPGEPAGFAYLFCTLDGGQLSDEYLRAMLRRLAAQAGIDKRVVPHGLRHTFAHELERSRTPLETISNLLGHSGVGVTQAYLQQLTNGEAVSELQEIVLPDLPVAPLTRDGARAPCRASRRRGLRRPGRSIEELTP